MSNPNLFLDIDGVLLARISDPAQPGLALAPHAEKFLEFALSNFDCRWLSTHCRDGDTAHLLAYLRPYCTDAIFDLIQQVKPTTWKTLKTEVLDPDDDWRWLDDSPLAFEIQGLKNRGLSDRWIEVNTNKRPDDLLQAMDRLREVAAPYCKRFETPPPP